MEFKEGQIYKGNITISGGDHGPARNWIISPPFNKTRLMSIDDPLDLHCWPIDAARKGIQGDYLKLVYTDIDHPAVHLQRYKEKLGISDIHLGLYGEHLNKMTELLRLAAGEGRPYAPFVAGEILAFIKRALHSKEDVTAIRRRVNEHLQLLEYRPASYPDISEFEY
ncbi:MAG: hypothetical protein LJE83_11210 [Gammaproteobacteria bacterium]|nr:hypothetical protein [Gammaproteobacteria bacterium]